MKIIIYKKSTGEILRRCEVPWSALMAQLRDGETYILGDADDSKFFIENYQVTPRPLMPIQVAKNEVMVGEPFRIEGIPSGCKVFYPNGNLVVDDGYIEWSSAVTGRFTFRLKCFPFREVSVYASVTQA